MKNAKRRPAAFPVCRPGSNRPVGAETERTRCSEGEIFMRSKIRLLGIAPYENMRSLMLTVAEEYDNIELTVFVGDLQQGVELARRNFYNDYDAIISRGGTASMLRKLLNLPVIEIAITAYDIMRAMHLAANVSDSYAIVGFPNITASAKQLCQLMQ